MLLNTDARTRLYTYTFEEVRGQLYKTVLLSFADVRSSKTEGVTCLLAGSPPVTGSVLHVDHVSASLPAGRRSLRHCHAQAQVT